MFSFKIQNKDYRWYYRDSKGNSIKGSFTYITTEPSNAALISSLYFNNKKDIKPQVDSLIRELIKFRNAT